MRRARNTAAVVALVATAACVIILLFLASCNTLKTGETQTIANAEINTAALDSDANTSSTNTGGNVTVVLDSNTAATDVAANTNTNTNTNGIPASSTINVLCFGDSNTYGYSPTSRTGEYQESQKWTTVLGNMLGSSYKVIRDGVNGRTTAFNIGSDTTLNGLAALPNSLKTNAPLDVVVFVLGTNDCATAFGLSATQVTTGMEKLVTATIAITQAIQGYVPEIVIVAPPELTEKNIGSSFNKKSVEASQQLASLYKELAARYDCWYLDASEGLELTTVDNEHLTATGHAQLAQVVYDLLAGLELTPYDPATIAAESQTSN